MQCNSIDLVSYFDQLSRKLRVIFGSFLSFHIFNPLANFISITYKIYTKPDHFHLDYSKSKSSASAFARRLFLTQQPNRFFQSISHVRFSSLLRIFKWFLIFHLLIFTIPYISYKDHSLDSSSTSSPTTLCFIHSALSHWLPCYFPICRYSPTSAFILIVSSVVIKKTM